MPILVFVYFTQFLDKNILSYASIMDFPVTGILYNNVAQAFYMGMTPSLYRPMMLGAFTDLPRLSRLDVSNPVYWPKVSFGQVPRNSYHCLGRHRHAARHLLLLLWLLRLEILPRDARSLREPDSDPHG